LREGGIGNYANGVRVEIFLPIFKP